MTASQFGALLRNGALLLRAAADFGARSGATPAPALGAHHLRQKHNPHRRLRSAAGARDRSAKIARGLALMPIWLLLAGAIANTAHANVTICVANDTGLANALIAAQFQATTIELVQGTYHLDATLFQKNYNTLRAGFELLGGYTSGCASRSIGSGNTVLMGDAEPLSGEEYGAEFAGNATFEGITFEIAWGFWIFYADESPVSVSDVLVTIRRCTFSHPSSGSLSPELLVEWQQDASIDGTVRLVNNLGYDSAGPNVAIVQVDTGHFDLVAINNTFYNPVGTMLAFVHDYENASGAAFLYNNILYSGASVGFTTDSSAYVLVDNVINDIEAPAPLLPPAGTLTVDPQLNASLRPIQTPPSPVINSGSNDVPGGLPAHDFDGGPRLVGTTVDRGAFESSVNDAFIQTVTNNNGSGAGSLRAAIVSANGNGSALIKFDIGMGCGPHVITLDSPLPDITVPVIINGFTQTGASPNDLDVGNDAVVCIVLEAGGIPPPDHAIGTASDAPAATQVTIEGLAFSNFTRAIDLQGGSGHEIAGNHFGGKVSGYSLSPNGTAIRLGAVTHDIVIGGDDPEKRNIIGDALGDAIVVQHGIVNQIPVGSSNDQILNNYIGIGWNPALGSYVEHGNFGAGIRLTGHDNVVSANLIGTNIASGILVSGGGATGNLIAGNFIGADADGLSFGNVGDGVRFAGSSGDAPHDNIVRSNTIANSTQAGVGVEIGQGNKIRKNSIYANGQLGIDLAGSGVTPNDDDGGLQLDDYANHGLNFPVLTGAIGGTDQGTVSGTLTTLPGDYTIDFYASAACDGSGHGEGQIWLKGVSITVPTPAIGDQGTRNFNATLKLALLGGRVITATATNTAGDTSEFSACITYTDDTIFANSFEPPPA
jgi:hypothetical protein